MCCEPSGYSKEEIDGKCPNCEEPTVEGRAYEECVYSPTICETCGWSPCDESC